MLNHVYGLHDVSVGWHCISNGQLLLLTTWGYISLPFKLLQLVN